MSSNIFSHKNYLLFEMNLMEKVRNGCLRRNIMFSTQLDFANNLNAHIVHLSISLRFIFSFPFRATCEPAKTSSDSLQLPITPSANGANKQKLPINTLCIISSTFAGALKRVIRAHLESERCENSQSSSFDDRSAKETN